MPRKAQKRNAAQTRKPRDEDEREHEGEDEVEVENENENEAKAEQVATSSAPPNMSDTYRPHKHDLKMGWHRINGFCVVVDRAGFTYLFPCPPRVPLSSVYRCRGRVYDPAAAVLYPTRRQPPAPWRVSPVLLWPAPVRPVRHVLGDD